MVKKKLFTCFVDFKKTYDSVWHDGLFYKLNKVGISEDYLGLLKNIYVKTMCAVKSGNSITDFFKFTKGVRQGCPLSPILFNIYVNDIFDRINKSTHTAVIIYKNTIANALMYADALILITHAKKVYKTKLTFQTTIV